MLLTEAEEVRGQLVRERHDELNCRQAICGDGAVPGSAVEQIT